MTTWMVEIEGYMPEPFAAETRRKATYRAYRQYREAVSYGLSFRDFLSRLRGVWKATSTDLVTL